MSKNWIFQINWIFDFRAKNVKRRVLAWKFKIQVLIFGPKILYQNSVRLWFHLFWEHGVLISRVENCVLSSQMTQNNVFVFSGATTIRLEMPSHMQNSLIFHYNLKFYGKETDNYEGISLKRFVMQVISNWNSLRSRRNLSIFLFFFFQSVVGNVVAFRVHAPCSSSLLLDIFANAVTPQEYLTGEPMKFKSVCKFKIVCEDLQTVMVPLPDCASGEWGPAKATRLFGLVPVTHEDALVFAHSNNLDITFRMTRPLTDFMATLHKNGTEEKKLSKYVSHRIQGDFVTLTVVFPEEGQYGMDIYTREVSSGHSNGNGTVDHDSEKHLLTHCCKYLINFSNSASRRS